MENKTNQPPAPTFKVSSDLLVAMGTVPLLMALVGGRAIAQSLQTLGQMSEEIFRGDRLPVLPRPSGGNFSEGETTSHHPQ